jgi:signal transduction histidine kinase
LRALADRVTTGPKVEVEVQEGAGERASADAGWHLARVAEEAVTNAYKYASATRIRIELHLEKSQLVLRIRDDGAGFDLSQGSKRGYGLVGMRERIEQLSGAFEIISAPGQGTEVRAAVPATAGA